MSTEKFQPQEAYGWGFGAVPKICLTTLKLNDKANVHYKSEFEEKDGKNDIFFSNINFFV